MSLSPDTHRAFANRREAFWQGIRDAMGAPVLVLMAGMVGSRNGWVEAPYRACPTSASDLARAMIPIDPAT